MSYFFIGYLFKENELYESYVLPTNNTMRSAITNNYYLSIIEHKRLLILYAVTLLTLGCNCQVHSSDTNTPVNSSRTLGGPCEYKDYIGKAEIVSIQKIEKNNASKSPKQSGELYKVIYRFIPDEKVQETFVHLESRELILLQTDFTYPDFAFIQKNSIVIGKKLDCILKVITKGACNPMIFQFPTLK